MVTKHYLICVCLKAHFYTFLNILIGVKYLILKDNFGLVGCVFILDIENWLRSKAGESSLLTLFGVGKRIK